MRTIPQWSIRAHGDNMELTGAVWHNEKWKNDLLSSRMVDDESDPDSEIDCRIGVESMDDFIALWGALMKTQARLSLFVKIEHEHANVWASLCDNRSKQAADISLNTEARSSAIEQAAIEAVKLLNGAMHKREDI